MVCTTEAIDVLRKVDTPVGGSKREDLTFFRATCTALNMSSPSFVAVTGVDAAHANEFISFLCPDVISHACWCQASDGTKPTRLSGGKAAY